PYNAALLCVVCATRGNYEVWIGGKQVRYAYTGAERPSLALHAGADPLQEIRDGLFEKLLTCPDLSIIPEPWGETCILLVPTADQMPAIRVQNDQNLNLIFGDMLHVRLEQQFDRMWFRNPDLASIGYNVTPFLINVPGQWRYRPGVLLPMG